MTFHQKYKQIEASRILNQLREDIDPSAFPYEQKQIYCNGYWCENEDYLVIYTWDFNNSCGQYMLYHIYKRTFHSVERISKWISKWGFDTNYLSLMAYPPSIPIIRLI